MAESPLVSIIVLNWNGERLLDECIQSLLVTAYTPTEIIVVDNASTDSSVNVVRKYPSVRLICNDKNYGYAEGNNIGISHAAGKYVVTLNNDITVDPAWLTAPVRHLEAHQSTGLVCLRQMSYYDHAIVDGLYHVVAADLQFLPFGAGVPMEENPQFKKAGYVLSVNGGSAVIRKSMLDAIGGFDTRFFAYLDETDLCMKAFLHDWRAFYTPESVVYHKGSVSFKKTGIFTYYLRERNRVWFLFKYFPVSMLLLRSPFLLLLELRVLRVMCFKLGRPDQYLRSRWDAVTMLPHYASLRRENLQRLTNRWRQLNALLRKALLDT